MDYRDYYNVLGVERSASGDGPVDAAFQAIEAATELGVALGTLKSRVRAAMERLGDLLDEGAVEVAS